MTAGSVGRHGVDAGCVNAEDVRALISRAMERVQSRASRGVISRALLVACSDARDDPYVALGLVVYEDVRRRGADETIRVTRARRRCQNRHR